MSLPDGVELRRIATEADVRALSAMQEDVFGDLDAEGMTRGLMRRLGLADGMELWVAEADGEIVSCRAARAGSWNRVRRDLGRSDRGPSGAGAGSTARSRRPGRDRR